MSGATFILAINLMVAGLLAAAFLALAVYDGRRTAGRWFVASYLLGTAYFGIEFAIPFFAAARLPVVAAFAVFLLATMAFTVGVARQYEVRAPWIGFGAFFLLATTFVFFVQDFPRHSFTRMMAYQLPYATMQFVALAVVMIAGRAWIDRLLAGALAFSALQFLSKPFLAHALGGWGDNPQAYLQSNYALASQAMGSIVAIALALLMLVILARDIIATADARSITDSLSGLLNRGGFDDRAAASIAQSRRIGMPVSVVIADLDHFKATNDTYGHASGDQVIRRFAAFLTESTADYHVVGRIGGEEFAILLPGTNLVAARLFAEGVRAAYAALQIDGFPPHKRFSASFGVAELGREETLPELLGRADSALYQAKKGGRNCVKISGRGERRATDVELQTAVRLD